MSADQSNDNWCRKSGSWHIPNVGSQAVHHKLLAVPIAPEVTVFCSAFFTRSVYDFATSEKRSLFAYELQATNLGNLAKVGCELNVSVKKEGTRVVWAEKKKLQLDSQPCKSEAGITQHFKSVVIVFDYAFSQSDLTRIGLKRRPILLSEFAKPLLWDKTFSDVTVLCHGRTFDCHKIVLAQRCEFFKTMLTGDFKEARENEVEIAAFQPDVVEAMLKFIYEDEVSEDALTWELFEAAKMYRLEKLEELCKAYLRKNVSVDTCCEMLEASFLHDLEELFVHAVAFFKQNRQQIVDTECWKRVKNNSDLMEKIVFQLAG